MDLSSASSGTITIGNRPERAAEIAKAIHSFLDGDDFDGRLLAKLRGRILFARSLCFGRFAGVALRALNVACAALAASARRTLPPPVAQDLRRALVILAAAITGSPARQVRVSYCLPCSDFH